VNVSLSLPYDSYVYSPFTFPGFLALSIIGVLTVALALLILNMELPNYWNLLIDLTGLYC